MTLKEARLKLREATGCSMGATLTFIPDPHASRAQLAGMAMQGLLAGDKGRASAPTELARNAVTMADALLAELAAREPR